MTLGDAAAWSNIIGLPLAIVGAFAAVAALGRQRDLRQRLRVVLDQVFKACDEFQVGNDDYLTVDFLRKSAERLRLLTFRDGLKSPSENHMTKLRDILLDIAARFDLPSDLPNYPPQAVPPEQRQQWLENNQQMLVYQIEQAKRRSVKYLRAVNRMDDFNYLIYLRFKRFGITRHTFGEVPSDFHTWTGPVD